MQYKNFGHLHIPETWKHYWTKYPEGYTILESLIEWVSQVDSMSNNLTDINTIVKEFINTFDNKLGDKVKDTLTEWQDSGFLNIIINEALETKYDEMDSRLTQAIEDITFLIYPTGTNNDTTNINSIIKNGGRFIFKKGVYHIEGDLLVSSNSVLSFEPGTILKKNPTSSTTYRVINIKDCSNVVLNSPHIIGDRLEHIGSDGEWGHGISVLNSSNITIESPIVEKCWGDGIYVGHDFYGTSTKITEHITINNPIVDNCRRNGISVCGGRAIDINKPLCKNINGTRPMTGIDIEPEGKGGVKPFLEDLSINDPVTENCQGRGITMYLREMRDNNKKTTINIKNHVDKFSSYGMTIGTLEGAISGTINIENPTWYRNSYCGFELLAYSAINTPKIRLLDPTVIESNTSNTSDDKNNTPYVILKDEGLTHLNYPIGNIDIIRPSVIDNRSNIMLTKSFLIHDYVLPYTPTKISIIDPIQLDRNGRKDNNMIRVKDIIISDSFNTLTTDWTYYLKDITSTAYAPLYRNKGAKEGVTFNLSNTTLWEGCEITFEVHEPYYIRVKPPSGGTLKPSHATGKYLGSNVVGSRITVKKVGSDWFIVNQVGNWIEQT